MLRSQLNNLFEKAFLWLKNCFNNWVKTNSEATISEIGKKQAEFCLKLTIGSLFILPIILIIFDRLNLDSLINFLLPFMLLLIFKLPALSIIKAFQFNFIRISKKVLLFLASATGLFSIIEILLAFYPESSEIAIPSLAFYPDLFREIINFIDNFIYFVNLSEPTVFNSVFWNLIIIFICIIVCYSCFCVLAGIYLYISLLEAWTIKIIAMLLAGKKAIPQGIMLVIIFFATGKIGHYLLQQKIGLF